MSDAEHADKLSGFVVAETLNDDPLAKTISLLGSFTDGREGQAIVQLTRRPFTATDTQRMVQGVACRQQQFQNDVYSKYAAELAAEDSLINVDLTYPATEKHISKARTQQFVMLRESPEEYAAVTEPFVKAIPTARLAWLKNILNKSAEAERLLFEDPHPHLGFMLHPDLKWDQKTANCLYCLAICHSGEVRSLRDLATEHLPLLRNIRDKGCKAIEEKYGVKQDSLRIFMHYQPSYYHFHVHFQHIAFPGAAGAAVGKAHLLDDVIDNIKLFGGEYYQRRTLIVSIGTGDPLLEAFRKRKACPSEGTDS